MFLPRSSVPLNNCRLPFHNDKSLVKIILLTTLQWLSSTQINFRASWQNIYSHNRTRTCFREWHTLQLSNCFAKLGWNRVWGWFQSRMCNHFQWRSGIRCWLDVCDPLLLRAIPGTNFRCSFILYSFSFWHKKTKTQKNEEKWEINNEKRWREWCLKLFIVFLQHSPVVDNCLLGGRDCFPFIPETNES